MPLLSLGTLIAATAASVMAGQTSPVRYERFTVMDQTGGFVIAPFAVPQTAAGDDGDIPLGSSSHLDRALLGTAPITERTHHEAR